MFLALLKVILPNMSDWHTLSGLKIDVTLSLNSSRNCKHMRPKFPLCKLMIKISFVLSNQKIFMQHFDSYNRNSILITILCFNKIPFP